MKKNDSVRYCRLCELLDDYPDELEEYIASYVARIAPADKVSDDEYDRRLKICVECDKLTKSASLDGVASGTCLACGCYIEIRAAVKTGACPGKKWR
ncbi:MAG: hypothetical protein J6P16_06450 [Eubacterium sp.]|nr:hypothetical protein [Eubacterium sp.]